MASRWAAMTLPNPWGAPTSPSARRGLRAGAITGVGQNNGRYLKWQLSCEGVDVSAVKTDSATHRDGHPAPGAFRHQYPENYIDMGLTAEHQPTIGRWAVLVTGLSCEV
ncbi:MAG: hypothetical protein ACLSHC_16485 [Bilophila wadsworthia]